MSINNGSIEMYVAMSAGGGVTVTITYDPATQNIIETGSGAERAALIAVNTSPAPATVKVSGPSGEDIYTVQTGTTRVRLNALNNRGIFTRTDIAGFSLASG